MKKLILLLAAVGLTIVLSGCSQQKTIVYQSIPQTVVDQEGNVQKENTEPVTPKTTVVLPAVDLENADMTATDLDNVKTRQGHGDVICQENSKFLVITKGSKSGVSDFLIKNKADSNQNISCSYEVGKADFEIKNQAATYFLALTNNFLVLDLGTGPAPRIMVAYNLNSRKKVFTDNYSSLTSAPGDIIRYWRKSAKEATISNCPKFDDYSGKGLGAIIEAYISLDLSTLVKKELGEYRCSPIQ